MLARSRSSSHRSPFPGRNHASIDAWSAPPARNAATTSGPTSPQHCPRQWTDGRDQIRGPAAELVLQRPHRRPGRMRGRPPPARVRGAGDVLRADRTAGSAAQSAVRTPIAIDGIIGDDDVGFGTDRGPRVAASCDGSRGHHAPASGGAADSLVTPSERATAVHSRFIVSKRDVARGEQVRHGQPRTAQRAAPRLLRPLEGTGRLGIGHCHHGDHRSRHRRHRHPARARGLRAVWRAVPAPRVHRRRDCLLYAAARSRSRASPAGSPRKKPR